jgi:L-histidine N-alpha-methyltransferase
VVFLVAERNVLFRTAAWAMPPRIVASDQAAPWHCQTPGASQPSRRFSLAGAFRVRCSKHIYRRFMPEFNVFISHISQEHELAELLHERIDEHFLKRAKVFVSSDAESVPAGSDWFPTIERALHQARILLVVCSKTSIQHPWINFEAGAARMKGIPIIPVCHSGLRPGDLKMPFATMQAVDAHEAEGLERLYSSISKRLKCGCPEINFQELAKDVRNLEAGYADAEVPSSETRLAQLLPTGYSPLESAIDHASLGWTLCFIGEDQSDKLAVLTEDLRRGFSGSGDGKRFASGFSYWGIGPTLAWARACRDPLYLVMKRSIESFPARWHQLKSSLTAPFHYVSLGVGTGTKDLSILLDLSHLNQDLYYFPVDMSPEMLRVGVKDYLTSKDIRRCRLLPIQIDFSSDRNVAELHQMLTYIVGKAPILFSLLGNTLANFEADTELLNTLRGLMRPQDRLLLEVATTVCLDEAAIEAAANEYSKSSAFRKFATSALLQYTDLPAGSDRVKCHGLREGDRAILIKVVYWNSKNRVIPVKLPDNTNIDLRPDDTIRLYISRKYTRQGITSVIEKAGFSTVVHFPWLHSRGEAFGLDLILLKQDPSYTPSVT